MTDGLLLNHFCAGYEGRWVVQEVHLHCPAGRLVHIQGENGDGRSTLLKGMMGLCDRQGEIALNGQNLATLAPWQIARLGTGYAPEERDLFRHLSVAEHFRLAQLSARHQAVVTQEELLETLPALKARWQYGAHVLSGGEQKMLALARALMTGRQLILLDEPCEGLAENVQASILSLLNQLVQRNVIILFTGAVSDTLRAERVNSQVWTTLSLQPEKKFHA
ncbi:MAG: ATP-binding cassette domain-containing protein [bacterium]